MRSQVEITDINSSITFQLDVLPAIGEFSGINFVGSAESPKSMASGTMNIGSSGRRGISIGIVGHWPRRNGVQCHLSNRKR